MICPRWVDVKAQPIAVEDVITYLMKALELPEGEGAIYEIGGADQVSYGENDGIRGSAASADT